MLLLDALKGTGPVLLAMHVFPEGPLSHVAVAYAAFLGHVFPVWLKGQGGKGVATFIGVLLGFSAVAVLVFAAIWGAIAALTRYSSLSGLLACAATPAVLWSLGLATPAKLFVVLAAFVFIMHREFICYCSTCQYSFINILRNAFSVFPGVIKNKIAFINFLFK